MIVTEPIEVKSLILSAVKSEIYINEEIEITVEVLPADAEDKSITWTSSDNSVAIIDSNGEVYAIGEGKAIITASSNNGISSAFEITVDGSKRFMKLNIQRARQDDYNIGDEWSYEDEINGERAAKAYALAEGDQITVYSKYTESDDNPDVGEAKKTYVVKEDDLQNGFSITLDVYVRENGGKNSGKKAYYIVTYTFSPATK